GVGNDSCAQRLPQGKRAFRQQPPVLELLPRRRKRPRPLAADPSGREGDRVRRRPQTVNRRSRIFCSGALAQGSVLLGSGRGVLEKPGFERERALRVRFAEVAETIVEGGLYLRGPPVAKGVKFDLIRRGGRTGLRSL